MPQPTQNTVSLDIAVIGGGIAGLWLMNRLRSLRFNCALFEKTALASNQTIASQGMIHGGMKYTLSGGLTKASESIADMPQHWLRCLAGNGDVDLSNAKTLSRDFYFWSSRGVASKMTTFLASKALKGRIDKIKPENYPAFLQNPEFRGQAYRLQDIVLDVPSVVESLRKTVEERLFLLPENAYQFTSDNDRNAALLITKNGQQLRIHAKRFIFTAGKGNGDLLKQLNIHQPQMQLRPLHQVWVKHDIDTPIFGHCLGTDNTPRLSFSTHPCSDGKYAWSLGGSLAENGSKQSADSVIETAQQELRELLPWITLNNAQWKAIRIDRAEAKQRDFLRPDKASVHKTAGVNNIITAWPTKLTLAPNLANEVISLLQSDKISPIENGEISALRDLERPTIATPPWDEF